MIERSKLLLIRTRLVRFYNTSKDRDGYFRLLKDKIKDTENGYVKRLKRSTTSMVSVMRSNNTRNSNLMNMGLGKTLWKYFNSPFNVMFVTTNIFTFAGVVALSTVIDIRKLHNSATHGTLELTGPPQSHTYFPESILYMDQNTIHSGKHFYPMITNIENNQVNLPLVSNDVEVKNTLEKQDETLQFLKKKLWDKVVEMDNVTTKVTPAVTLAETPFQTYTMDNLKIDGKAGKVATYNSVQAKSSLFNMLYSFTVYEDLVNDVQSDKIPKSWAEELKFLKNQNITNTEEDINDAVKCVPSVNSFYYYWKIDTANNRRNSNVTDFENFKIPAWTMYPTLLQVASQHLYDNKMESLSDFDDYYKSIKSTKIKKLLRLWLYDNFNLMGSQNQSHEIFYNHMLKDSLQDSKSFNKFASIILDPVNTRNNYFFNTVPSDTTSSEKSIEKVPIAQVNTLLNVLQGYINLQNANKDNNYNEQLLRIIHMLKCNGYVVGENDIRIQLCQDKVREHSWLHKSRDNSQVFETLGKDPRVLELLSQIS